jgi:hypothetical protein
MNGLLMSEGIFAISVPANEVQIYNKKITSFKKTRNATELFTFLVDCHPLNNAFNGFKPLLKNCF